MAQLIRLNLTSAWLWNCPWQGGAHPLAAARLAALCGGRASWRLLLHILRCLQLFMEIWKRCLPPWSNPAATLCRMEACCSSVCSPWGHWCPLGIKEPLGKQGPPPMFYLTPVGSEGGELYALSSLSISPFF